MKVFKRPGSSYYAYKFQFQGQEYYRSTGTRNQREAEAIAAAARASVVRQAAGLEPTEPELGPEPAKKVPTLRQFQVTFDQWVGTAKSDQNGTIKIGRASCRERVSPRV